MERNQYQEALKTVTDQNFRAKINNNIGHVLFTKETYPELMNAYKDKLLFYIGLNNEENKEKILTLKNKINNISKQTNNNIQDIEKKNTRLNYYI